MNNNQNSVFIVSYCSDTIEGKGPMETVAITTSLEEAKRIGEKLPKVMGISPTATIYEHVLDTYKSFSNKNTSYYSNHKRCYRLDNDGNWLLWNLKK